VYLVVPVCDTLVQHFVYYLTETVKIVVASVLIIKIVRLTLIKVEKCFYGSVTKLFY
jgi:hypothetical protein